MTLAARAPATRRQANSRLPYLDGIRAIGIGLVVLHHLNVPGLNGGRFGVDVFFPLSGYLITTLLVRELDATGAAGLRRFYWRRATRLYPALLVTVALAFAGWRSGLFALLYATNVALVWGEHARPDALTHTWSLALEEQFYLLWPLVLVGLARLGLSRRVIAAGCIAATAASWCVLATAGAVHAYFGPDARAGGLLIGCAFALIVSDTGVPAVLVRLNSLALPLVAAGLVIGASHAYERAGNTIGIPFLSVATVLVLARVLTDATGPTARALSNRALVWLGERSYGLYLVHFGIVRALPGRGWLALALSLAACDLLYRFVEQPVLRWRDRQSTIAG